MRLTAGFERDLNRIEAFFDKAGGAAFDRLVDDLLDEVIPLLEVSPRLGTRWNGEQLPPDGQVLFEQVRRRLKGQEARRLVRGDFVLLYLVGERAVWLVSVRHHRELSFRLGEET